MIPCSEVQATKKVKSMKQWASWKNDSVGIVRKRKEGMLLKGFFFQVQILPLRCCANIPGCQRYITEPEQAAQLAGARVG